MSESRANIARRVSKGESENASREPYVLPQWALEILRPGCGVLARLLWRIEFAGVENIPTGAGGFIIAANHQTYIDPFWASIPIKRPTRYLAWNEAFRWFLVGKIISLLGAYPIQLEGGDPCAYRRALNWLRGDGALVIFPEGGRCYRDGAMHRFKPGAARIALEAGVPILPVTIRGGNRVWARGMTFPRLAKVEVVYHPLQHLSVQPGEDARRAARRETERLAATIASAL